MKKYLANLFTLLNLIFGCIAIIYILNGWAIVTDYNRESIVNNMCNASLWIVFAAVIDFFDGLIARILNASSEMGKQLDSLADLVSFGVAPGLIIFQFLKMGMATNGLNGYQNIWYLLPALLIPCAGAFRLARFNLSHSKSLDFEGLPIPAGGILIAAIPLIAHFNHYDFIEHLFLWRPFWYIVILLISFLMVSTLPMMSMKFKNLSLKQNWSKFLLVLIAIVAAFIFKWLAVPVVFIFYTVLSLLTLKKANKIGSF